VGGGVGVLLQEGGTEGKQLYPMANDVQTQRVNFFNIRLWSVVKTWYTFRKFLNRRGRWIKEPLRSGLPVHKGGM